MVTHCEKMGDRIAILDIKLDLPVSALENSRTKANINSRYWWIFPVDWDSRRYSRGSNSDPTRLYVPPSGHIAGVFARVDASRGVHKAPANVNIAGACGLKHDTTRDDLENLFRAGLNCIRAFPGQGILIWGARTLSSDPQWRYINVQRLVCNIEDFITEGIRWAVFEPNDQVLWAAIRRDISAYLTRLWRLGALFGKTPAEAFYVKCDEETNRRRSSTKDNALSKSALRL